MIYYAFGQDKTSTGGETRIDSVDLLDLAQKTRCTGTGDGAPVRLISLVSIIEDWRSRGF